MTIFDEIDAIIASLQPISNAAHDAPVATFDLDASRAAFERLHARALEALGPGKHRTRIATFGRWQQSEPMRIAEGETVTVEMVQKHQLGQWCERLISELKAIAGEIEMRPPAPPSAPPPSRKGVGGAPTKYSWAEASGYMTQYFVENDYPKTKAEAEQVLTDWFAERGEVPDKRDIQKWIAEAWKI